MRKLIVTTFITLDGVMQAPGGPEEDTSSGFKYGGWIVPYFDELLGKVMAEQMKQPFALLLGRKTFEIFASYWPQNEDKWPGVNDATKYMVSTIHDLPEWKNSVLIKGDVVEEIIKLKAQNGPNLHVYGSSVLVQMLMKYDLVDEFWLKIFPITLGSGKRLFGEGTQPANLRLIDSKISNTGVIIATYTPAGQLKTGSFALDNPGEAEIERRKRLADEDKA